MTKEFTTVPATFEALSSTVQLSDAVLDAQKRVGNPKLFVMFGNSFPKFGELIDLAEGGHDFNTIHQAPYEELLVYIQQYGVKQN